MSPRKNGLPYYKRYPRDFIEGTIGMPFELKGAYSILLDLIYMQGGSLPDNAQYIAGLLGMSVRKWNGAKTALIEQGKITVVDGSIQNYRAIIELESLRSLQDKQAENARGARKNNDLPEPRQQPKTSHTEPDSEVRKNNSVIPKKVARGSRLPADWELPNEWGRWACDEFGVPAAAVRMEAAKFRDYWIAKTGQQATKNDWQATWRNWCRTAFAKTGGRGLAAPSSRQPTAADIGRQLLEEMENAGRGETSAGTDHSFTRQLGAPLQREPS